MVSEEGFGHVLSSVDHVSHISRNCGSVPSIDDCPPELQKILESPDGVSDSVHLCEVAVQAVFGIFSAQKVDCCSVEMYDASPVVREKVYVSSGVSGSSASSSGNSDSDGRKSEKY